MFKNKCLLIIHLLIIYRTGTKNREVLLSGIKSRSHDFKILIGVPFLLRSFW